MEKIKQPRCFPKWWHPFVFLLVVYESFSCPTFSPHIVWPVFSRICCHKNGNCCFLNVFYRPTTLLVLLYIIFNHYNHAKKKITLRLLFFFLTSRNEALIVFCTPKVRILLHGIVGIKINLFVWRPLSHLVLICVNDTLLFFEFSWFCLLMSLLTFFMCCLSLWVSLP